MTPMLKNLLILLALIVLGATGYYLFFNSGSEAIVSTGGSGNINSEAAFQTREFRSILSDLNNVDLDSTLFQDQNFLNMTDHAQQIVERPYGRSNPFDGQL